MAGYYTNHKLKIMCGSQKIKKGFYRQQKIYASGNVVTYHVDSGVTYQEEVDEGASILSPKSFVPSKSGYTFIGWRPDSIAAGNVISSAYSQSIMGDSPVTLYAVFQQIITLSYYGNGASSGSVSAQTGIRYYNNGNVANPTFTLVANGYGYPNYVFSGWAMGSAGGTQYPAGSAVTLSTSTLFYASWVQSSYQFGYTGGVQSFTAPVSGTYKLETWGAEGGLLNCDDHRGTPGKGGYATGSVYLQTGTVLYICVGESGNNGFSYGSYNGGGGCPMANYWGNQNGGGATHIAINTNRGVLANYANYRSEVLIVAGGGGAAGRKSKWGGKDYNAHGGSGGGTTGGYGCWWNGAAETSGGSQTAGGIGGGGTGSFGQGANGYTPGGGGWYGGGSSPEVCDSDDDFSGTAGGGGGSGYIGGVSNGSMANGYQTGNGHATITLQGIG